MAALFAVNGTTVVVPINFFRVAAVDGAVSMANEFEGFLSAHIKSNRLRFCLNNAYIHTTTLHRVIQCRCSFLMHIGQPE